MKLKAPFDRGWSVGQTVFHFSPICTEEATRRAGVAEALHVVETVKWAKEGDAGDQTINLYFAFNLAEAVALASFLAAEREPENVIGVRPATKQEEREHSEAFTALCQRALVFHG